MRVGGLHQVRAVQVDVEQGLVDGLVDVIGAVGNRQTEVVVSY